MHKGDLCGLEDEWNLSPKMYLSSVAETGWIYGDVSSVPSTYTIAFVLYSGGTIDGML